LSAEEKPNLNEKIPHVSQDELISVLESYERDLKRRLSTLEIDVEEAVDLYLTKRDETEELIERGLRQNGRYRVKLFDDSLVGLREIETGVLRGLRLDLQKLTNEELLLDSSRDLRTITKDLGGILGGLTRWLSKYGAGTKEEKLQARYYQAMTKLLTVLARQNQMVINILQSIESQAHTPT
jgi:hypothetical protein